MVASGEWNFLVKLSSLLDLNRCLNASVNETNLDPITSYLVKPVHWYWVLVTEIKAFICRAQVKGVGGSCSKEPFIFI